jgi:serine/threonine protein kinase
MDDATQRLVLGGRYVLGAVIGRGGMGTVHDATDRRLSRSVAVKILRPDLAEQPRARRRFETEARAAAQLSHPNVVTVYDSGEDDGVPYLVMERLPGRTLADELASGPLRVDRARAIGLEMLAALGAAHEAGILHRDVKPGNVLLTADGHAKVSDFGIAKTVDDSDQTQTAELVATVAYLAPERLGGDSASQRSDLYSVGVVLYEALSGRRAFTGDTPVGVMISVERGDIEPLATVSPAVPPEVASVVERAMARKPQRRFESAREMADALESASEVEATVPVEPPQVADTVPIDLSETAAAPTSVQPPLAERPESSTRSPRTRRVVGATVGVLVAIIVVAGLTRGHNGSPRTQRQSPTTQTTPTTGSLPQPLEKTLQALEQAVGR